MPFKGQTITKTLVTHIKNTELILKKKKTSSCKQSITSYISRSNIRSFLNLTSKYFPLFNLSGL